MALHWDFYQILYNLGLDFIQFGHGMLLKWTSKIYICQNLIYKSLLLGEED